MRICPGKVEAYLPFRPRPLAGLGDVLQGLHPVTPTTAPFAHVAVMGQPLTHSTQDRSSRHARPPLTLSPNRAATGLPTPFPDAVGTTGRGVGTVLLIISNLARFREEKRGDRVTTNTGIAK